MSPSATSSNAARAGNALEVEGLTVRFGRTAVLEHLSFEVPRASSLAIIGPNGSGKTVLFKALVGALPHEGTIRWAEGTRLGYVPQKLDIERDLPITGADLLRAKAMVTRGPRDEMASALSIVGLPVELSAQPLGALSGGQFQRLLVAVA
ncbi:MAG: ATP-binding cassette domain-containing protein, partial [Polyangiaceae bacterium]